MTTNVEAGSIVELTVLALDGRRLLVRGILDSPLRFASAVVIFEPAPLQPPPCDHKFVDSTACLKCGWTPPSRKELT